MADIETLVKGARDARLDEDGAAARDLLKRALRLARSAGDEPAEALIMTRLGVLDVDEKHFDQAITHYSAALRIYMDLAETSGEAHCLRHMADVHLENQDALPAKRCVDRALSLMHGEEVTPLNMANAFRIAARVYAANNESNKSRNYWKKARKLYEIAGVAEGVEECDRELERGEAAAN